MLKSSPLLSAGPTQQRDGDRPRINLGLNGCEHNQNQILGLQKLCFLLCSWSCECPASLAGVLEMQSIGELGGNALSFVSFGSQLFAGGKTACGGRQIYWLDGG